MRSPDATPLMREATTRLLAELSAAGFDAVEVEAPADADPRAVSEQIGESGLATLVLRPVARGAAIDVWISDSITHKTSVRRVQVAARGKSGAAKVIALHAVELLRASLLEAASPPKQEEVAQIIAPTPLPAPVAKLVAPEPPIDKPAPAQDEPPRFGIEAAAALLQGFQAIGTAPAPMLAAQMMLHDRINLRASFVGPAFGADVATPTGSATIRQELATLELDYALLGRNAPVVPRAVLGGGAYHLHARGSASPPYLATSDDTWSAIADVGLGFTVRLGTHAALVADARALFLFPRPVVVIADSPPSSTGRPSLLASLGVLASF